MIGTMITPGAAVKCAKLAGGLGRISGYLVRHTDENEVDCTLDFFTEQSDLGSRFMSKIPLTLDHGRGELGARIIADLSFRRDRKGLFVWTDEFDLNNPLLRPVFQAAQAGVLGWSSSSLTQFIQRVKVKNREGKMVNWLKSWFVNEGALTSRACDSRTSAQATIPIKSFQAAPLTQVLDMSPAERIAFERVKLEAHLQRAVSEGIKLDDDTMRRFKLLPSDWLQRQAQLHSRNRIERPCGCHQTKDAAVDSTPAEFYTSQRRGRALSMRIPAF